MTDILVFAMLGLGIYAFYKIMMKESIIPGRGKKKKNTPTNIDSINNTMKKSNKKKKVVVDPLAEDEAAPFGLLFPEVLSMDNNMIHLENNQYIMIAEVEPVNYYLLDQSEQNGIDAIFETWLAQINYHVRIYLQNRYVDLADPINEIQKNMDLEDDMDPLAKQFGQNLIQSLKSWQNAQPRYETKRYILFDYQVDPKEIKADDQEDLSERILDKAFNELHRRVTTAKSQLRKADINVRLLSTDGISEVLYYAFNRRKAVKNRYRDIEEQEMHSLYVTSDQTAEQIVRVKGEIDSVQKETQEV